MGAKVKLVPVRAVPPPKEELENGYRQTIELTGNGNLLCYEGFFGRWFRSSEVCVREAVAKYIDLYNGDEFREGEYVNFNDLYALLGIASTHIGAEYGYATNPDYKVTMEFDIVRIPEDENFEGMNEEVLVIEPAGNWSYPMECYMEV